MFDHFGGLQLSVRRKVMKPRSCFPRGNVTLDCTDGSKHAVENVEHFFVRVFCSILVLHMLL